MDANTNLTELYQLLDEAQQLSARFSGGYSDHFFSAEEFHAALVSDVKKLKDGDKDATSAIDSLWLWFAPSYDWDDFTGGEGVELGNRIFTFLSGLRKM